MRSQVRSSSSGARARPRPRPKPEWDAHQQDLSGYKLTEQEQEARKQSRVSKNRVVISDVMKKQWDPTKASAYRDGTISKMQMKTDDVAVQDENIQNGAERRAKPRDLPEVSYSKVVRSLQRQADFLNAANDRNKPKAVSTQKPGAHAAAAPLATNTAAEEDGIEHQDDEDQGTAAGPAAAVTVDFEDELKQFEQVQNRAGNTADLGPEESSKQEGMTDFFQEASESCQTEYLYKDEEQYERPEPSQPSSAHAGKQARPILPSSGGVQQDTVKEEVFRNEILKLSDQVASLKYQLQDSHATNKGLRDELSEYKTESSSKLDLLNEELAAYKEHSSAVISTLQSHMLKLMDWTASNSPMLAAGAAAGAVPPAMPAPVSMPPAVDIPPRPPPPSEASLGQQEPPRGGPFADPAPEDEAARSTAGARGPCAGPDPRSIQPHQAAPVRHNRPSPPPLPRYPSHLHPNADGEASAPEEGALDEESAENLSAFLQYPPPPPAPLDHDITSQRFTTVDGTGLPLDPPHHDPRMGPQLPEEPSDADRSQDLPAMLAQNGGGGLPNVRTGKCFPSLWPLSTKPPSDAEPKYLSSGGSGRRVAFAGNDVAGGELESERALPSFAGFASGLAPSKAELLSGLGDDLPASQLAQGGPAALPVHQRHGPDPRRAAASAPPQGLPEGMGSRALLEKAAGGYRAWEEDGVMYADVIPSRGMPTLGPTDAALRTHIGGADFRQKVSMSAAVAPVGHPSVEGMQAPMPRRVTVPRPAAPSATVANASIKHFNPQVLPGEAENSMSLRVSTAPVKGKNV